jgi:hypothetical protein
MDIRQTLRPRTPRIGIALALLAGLALGVARGSPPAASGGGCGHDPRLDDADDALLKASVLIAISQNPGVVPPFGGHDELALRAIQRARDEVAMAIAYSEQSCR